MSAIMNCLDEENKTVIGGNHFVFKPRQIKHIYQPNIASVFRNDKLDLGFIEVPEECLDTAYALGEGKAIIEERRKQGVDAFCKRLRIQIYNLQVSLKNDLDVKNLKVDPRVFASDGDILAMELLAKYQTNKEDESQKKIDRIKELEKKLATK